MLLRCRVKKKRKETGDLICGFLEELQVIINNQNTIGVSTQLVRKMPGRDR